MPARGLHARAVMTRWGIVRLAFALLAGCGPVTAGHGAAGGGGGGGGAGSGGSGIGGAGGSTSIPNNCPSGQALPTLSGIVYAPNGLDPIAGALVYVPMGPPQPLPGGNQCDACATVPGAWVQTHSGPTGGFAFPEVPAGAIQVVVEMGHFRRIVAVNAPCGGSVMLTAAESRLPRNATEGDIPKVAVATGAVDKMQDVLSKIGLEEFDLYQGKNPAPQGNTYPMLDALLMDANRLATYQIVLINCRNSYEPLLASGPATQNLERFVHAGGRLFVDDLSYEFVEWPFPQAVDFEPDSAGAQLSSNMPQSPMDAAEIGSGGTTTMPSPPVSAQVTDDTLKMWLAQFPSTVAADGSIQIQGWLNNWAVMHAVPATTKVWVQGMVSWNGGSGVRPLSVGLDYKGVDGTGCGRIVYNSYHTVPLMSSPSAPFIPQERILEYLFFQIATCIQIG
ncbi:MAG TPA: carboxypeptidase-like regulatory domain-containing protein [Polyangia bacterium]|nr:carboxypeptidase-like regulatory domain-containing protein [Polyangia bacterium]